MNPRIRRLRRDEIDLRSLSGNDSLEVHAGPGAPPEQYVLRYYVPGVTRAPNSSQPEVVHAHQIRMILPSDYPRVKPAFLTETRVFHPNFEERNRGAVCIADFWTAGFPITDVVFKVGMMLQYQIYNEQSPLNEAAAHWVRQNKDAGIFPIGTIQLHPAEPVVTLGAPIAVDIGAGS